MDASTVYTFYFPLSSSPLHYCILPYPIQPYSTQIYATLPYLSDMPPRHIQSADEVLWHESIEHWHHVGDTIAYRTEKKDESDDDGDMMMIKVM